MFRIPAPFVVTGMHYAAAASRDAVSSTNALTFNCYPIDATCGFVIGKSCVVDRVARGVMRMHYSAKFLPCMSISRALGFIVTVPPQSG
jgi:hypothetical protein